MRGASGRALLAAAALLAPWSHARGAPADILIVERPGALVLYDMYQQRLGPAAAAALPSFVPILLLRTHDVMGDGFTPCADVSIDGTTYYLQEESSGAFSTTGPCGYTALLRGVTVREDSLLLLGGEALRLRVPSSREEIRLAPGTRALRLFELKRETYVRIASDGERYGWVVLSPAARGTLWRILPGARPAEIAEAEVLRRVRSVTDGANSTLRRIYRSLSPATATVPAFRVSTSARGISCEVIPPALAPAFDGSLVALIAPLERALGGTGLHPAMAGNAIRIPLP